MQNSTADATDLASGTLLPAVTSNSSPAAPRSGDGFDVQPAALIGAAGAFDAEADAVLAAVGRLHHVLGTLAQPWGADDVGVRFGAAYQPAAEQVTANIAALSGGMSRIAAALRAVAQSYDLADTFAGSTVAGSTSAGSTVSGTTLGSIVATTMAGPTLASMAPGASR